MSSPMSSLKKGKKLPLNPRSNIPYRNPSALTDQSQNEEDLFNDVDIPSSFLKREIINKLPKPSHKQQGHSSVPSDTQLLTTMATRLSQAEQQLKASTREIIDKDKKIKILEEKVHLLERARNYGSDNIQELEKKCRFLKNQVYEMESFLSDYGMVWVGESEDSIEAERNFSSYVEMSEESPTDLSSTSASLLTQGRVWQQDKSVGVPNFKMDFDLVVQNIEELNILANEGTSKIQHNKSGARLKVQDSVPLCLYSNGILMFDGPFRPYTEPTTQICMQDVMDGFFPSELQGRYPDGVPFQVTDRREMVYKDKRTQLLFPGEGQKMNPEADGTNIKETSERIGSGQRLSMEQFLSKLPQSVVKNGKIVDVRSGVADTIQGSAGKNSVTVVETNVIQDMKERAEKDSEQESLQDVTTLRIKSESGDKVFILKMKFTDTISDVRQYLDNQRDPSLPTYDIKTSFPNKVYDDPRSTLQECGLVPNATLHLLARR